MLAASAYRAYFNVSNPFRAGGEALVRSFVHRHPRIISFKPLQSGR